MARLTEFEIAQDVPIADALVAALKEARVQMWRSEELCFRLNGADGFRLGLYLGVLEAQRGRGMDAQAQCLEGDEMLKWMNVPVRPAACALSTLQVHYATHD
jgi:hypothetical protein